MNAGASPAYEMRHTVSFAETNLVGNVYFTRHLEWQGRCREMFLRDHCPAIIDLLRSELALITLHCSCDYLDELYAFDDIVLHMRLGDLTQNRIRLDFEYLRKPAHGEPAPVAHGRQLLAVMQRRDGQLSPMPLPDMLRAALLRYR
ncbi:enediyne biosynthesis thioesterase [Xanthomonas translucens]